MPKTYYKKKSKYTKKKRTTTLAKRGTTMQNPKEYFSTGRAKIFPPMPTSFGVKATFTADPWWQIGSTVSGGGFPNITQGQPVTSFLFLHLLDMEKPLSDTGYIDAPAAYWHSTNHLALCQVYQEFQYQTTYITLDMVLDSYNLDPDRTPVKQVQVVAKITPLSQLKRMLTSTLTTPLQPSDSGIMYSGLDYYGMLTGSEGAKQMILTDDGNRGGSKMSFKIDAFEHGGIPVKGTVGVIRNTTDLLPSSNAARSQSLAVPTYASVTNLNDQQVLLIAFRWFQNLSSNPGTINPNKPNVRCNVRCDQHWIYSDPFLNHQDIFFSSGIPPDAQ
jgi:hypothetical protein